MLESLKHTVYVLQWLKHTESNLFYSDWRALHTCFIVEWSTPHLFYHQIQHAAFVLQWNEEHCICSTVTKVCLICSTVQWSALHLLCSGINHVLPALQWNETQCIFVDRSMLHLFYSGMKHTASAWQWNEHTTSLLQWNETHCICFPGEWGMLHVTHTQYLNGNMLTLPITQYVQSAPIIKALFSKIYFCCFILEKLLGQVQRVRNSFSILGNKSYQIHQCSVMFYDYLELEIGN